MFNTGNGEILPCVGCYQLPFWVTLLVVTRYVETDIKNCIIVCLPFPGFFVAWQSILCWTQNDL